MKLTGDFKEDVFALTARIPAGKVVSYGQLSLLAGRPRSARVVAQLMSRHSDGRNLPCHRVVRSDGSLCEGTLFGLMQRELLRGEGVPFAEDGRVSMRDARWDGPA